jgi:hypothetical protein
LQADKDKFLTLWLADQVCSVVKDEKEPLNEVLNIAKKNISE